MKKFLQKIVKKLYWKLNCHTTEPWANQLVLYTLPYKLCDREITVLAMHLNSRLNKFEPLVACHFPHQELEVYKKMELNELNWKK